MSGSNPEISVSTPTIDQLEEYPKIQTIWHRDPATKNRTLLEGVWSEKEFAYLADATWRFSEKVDGTNIRVHIIPSSDAIVFGGKTAQASIPSPLLQRLMERFYTQKAKLFEMFPGGGILYGEGYGAKIQKAGERYRSDQDFVLFDVKVGDWWLYPEDQHDVANRLDLDVVPKIGRGSLYDMIKMVQSGFRSYWGDFNAEGIVARPLVELCSQAGKRIITKLKAKDFR